MVALIVLRCPRSSPTILYSYALTSPTLLFLNGVVCFARLHSLGVLLGGSPTLVLMWTSSAITVCLHELAYTRFALHECLQHLFTLNVFPIPAKPVLGSLLSKVLPVLFLHHRGVCQLSTLVPLATHSLTLQISVQPLPRLKALFPSSRVTETNACLPRIPLLLQTNGRKFAKSFCLMWH